MNPKWPIYIVSKGRADSRLTHLALSRMRVPHFLVIEPQQLEMYAKVIDRKHLLTLPLGDHGKGPGLARNWAWAHAKMLGAEWHWVMDDNIRGFFRWHANRQILCDTGAIFRAMEDFCERYENVLMAGPQYFMFAPRKVKVPPYIINTRIYSCNLIRNDSPFKWRGRYNEDTDLSLCMLKAGYCTVQFNAFLQWKMPTQTVKGGNSIEFYDKEGTTNKSKLLELMHPDVARVSWKFNRWHHEVYYGGFKQQLKRKKNITLPETNDEYGMILRRKEEEDEVLSLIHI